MRQESQKSFRINPQRFLADDDIVVVPSNISVKGESGRAGRRAHLPRQQSRPVPVLE